MNEEKCVGVCEYMKNHKWCKIVSVVVIAMIVAFFCGGFGHEGGWDKNSQKDTIVVSGKGDVTTKPDIATVSFSVMEENMDVSKASDAVNTKMANILASLKKNGVVEADIKTTGYNIYPRYDYVNSAVYPYGGKQKLAGYDVTENISLKIRDLTKAGAIVSDLGTLGITDMSGLNFTNDKYDDLVLQARDAAIKDAREQAEKLAKSLGVRLGKIVSYSEGGYSPMPYYDRATSMGAAPMMAKSEAVLPTGENKITSNVSITYEIK